MNFIEDQENPCGQPSGFVDLEPQDYCFIDNETAKTLELVQNNVEPSNKKHCLFGFLNTNTATTTGARLLRETILRPLCHLPTLEHRLDCIDYLIQRMDVLGTISNCVKKFGSGVDLDSVVPCLITLYKSQRVGIDLAEKRLEALTTLESLVSQVAPLVCALDTDQKTLNVYRIALADPAYEAILNIIYNVIETDIRVGTARRSKMFRIKHGVETLFDIARSTYNAAINDLEQYVREINNEDGLWWKLSYNNSRGYYLFMDAGSLPKNFVLPPHYVRVQRTHNAITCTTKDLMQSNVRANVSYENSMKLANEILMNTIGAIMDHVSALHKLVDIIGILDLTTSFAKLVAHSQMPMVRPKYTASETIIVRGRHPVLESVLAINNLSLVPNDTVLNVCNQNFLLITGPNMGGKSVYLKQVGVIQVMAQLGCYVPAETAHIKIMNQIIARSGTNDDNQSNCSSFMWEMKGIASALKQDEGSRDASVLYIIDEVGRGTSIDDGASYSFAIAEELASRRYCFTVFATHFEQVFSLTRLYGNIHAHHFKYDDESESPGKLQISHELVAGFAEKDHYGIKLAEACGLPSEILIAAKVSAEINI